MMPYFDFEKYENLVDYSYEQNAQNVEWNQRENERYAQFKEDAIRYVGLHDHPKREMIWEYICNQFNDQDIQCDRSDYECFEWKLYQLATISQLFK